MGVRLLSTQNPAEQLHGGAGVYTAVQTCNTHIAPQSIHRIPRVGKRTSRRPGEQIHCFPNKSTGSSSISPDASAPLYCHPCAAGSARFDLVDPAPGHKLRRIALPPALPHPPAPPPRLVPPFPPPLPACISTASSVTRRRHL